MMISKWFFLLLLSLPVQFCFAQPSDLTIQGVSPNLYLTHTVQAKENWYSVGRIYNISPKQLAPYNGLTLEKPLSIGQTLKVPLTAENFSQDGSKAADEIFVPLHHIVQPKEWMYRVSTNYNKVPVENLEKWNGIKKEQVKAGLRLVVGYLKVKQAQSSLASRGVSRIDISKAPVVADNNNNPSTKSSPPNAEAKTAPHTETKPENTTAPVVTTPPHTDPPPVNTAQPVKEGTKPVLTQVSNTANNSRLSYFANQYEETGKSISGNAGVFKSTSGWNDGKYYALVNNVPVGTIVKINNPVSGKTIFAKVLGNLPDMKESIGLIARVSDAGAAQIEGTGLKFSVEVRY